MCEITRGRTSLPCKNNIGGFKSIYITNFSDINFNGSSTAAGHIITVLPLAVISSNTFRFELKNSGNTFNQDVTPNRDTGTTEYVQTLNFILPNLSSELEFQMKMLTMGRPYIFAEANNGQVILLGERFGCEVTGKSEIQGTLNSMVGYSMVAVATEGNPVWYLSPAAITSLRAVASTASVAV